MLVLVFFWFRFREVLCSICVLERDAYVCVFEEVGQFPYPRAVVGEDCPFFWFGLCFASFGFLWCVFCCI
jgi:hypothetical protein